jgi:outer membrane protein OmpA-like peptidoglycan-associated protein
MSLRRFPAMLAAATIATAFGATFGFLPMPVFAQQPQPAYRVTMVPRTILAVNYEHRTKTDIGFRGSPLMPLAKGDASVESKNGRIAVSANLRDISPASQFGPEYVTYVLWAITPEGTPMNLGEVLRSGDKSKLQVTTTLQTFGLIVTAEPYYAVSEPSDVVVLENVLLPETAGTLQQVNVNYRLFKRGVYSYNVGAAPAYAEINVPLELQEARNAVQIATNEGASQYAPDPLATAQQSLRNAEALAKKGDKKVLVQNSRDAVQNAAEAVQQTIQRKADEEQAAERTAAAQRTAQAQAAAEDATRKSVESQAEAEAATAKQQQEAAARQQAELQRQQADLQRQQAELQSQRDAQAAAQAQQAADQAKQAAAQAELEKQQLRAALLDQFNRILPTTDTPRGLKANLSDVLFATSKYELQPAAREALAKFTGIVLAHPGLRMQIDGYTDSTGSDDFNQTLSENRANSVRSYLIGQGLDPSSIMAMGYGKSNPVAGNDTAAGRQQNRRVEIIISGEIIGTQIGGQQSAPQNAQPPTQ